MSLNFEAIISKLKLNARRPCLVISTLKNLRDRFTTMCIYIYI